MSLIRRLFWTGMTLVGLASGFAALWLRLNPLAPWSNSAEPPVAVDIGMGLGYVSRSGEMVIPPVPNRVSSEFGPDGLARVCLDGRIDWIDRTGRTVCTFDGSQGFAFDTEGMARVADWQGKWGWINRNGQVVIPSDWDTAMDFDVAGMALVSRDEKYGWIDRRGKVVIAVEWNSVAPFNELGVASVQRDKKWGAIDRSGRAKIAVERDFSAEFDSRGWSVASRLGKWGWLDFNGKVALALEWDQVLFDFDKRDLAAVVRDRRILVIDRSGRIIATPRCDVLRPSDSLGWSKFLREGQWGWFDDRWNEAIPPQLKQEPADFDYNGLACIKSDQKYGLLDRRGHRALAVEWNFLDATASGYRTALWHPITDVPILGGIVEKVGWQDSPPFDSLTVLYDKNLNAYWRSDLYALRPLLWPTAAGGLLLGAFSIWRLRRLAKKARAAA